MQIPTPTYKLAKELNKMIAPYTPSQYSLRSTDEFLAILRTMKPNGILASLDVESLFTNVPIEATIDIILKNVYHHESIPPLKLPPKILAELTSCTSMALF